MSPGGHRGAEGEHSSLGGVRESDLALDRLAARVPLDPTDDEVLRLLAGWAEVVDAEVAAATPRSREEPPLHGHVPTDLLPVRRTRAGRTPWWLLSAGAAAVIAVMAVGLGAQDVAETPPSTVAESVQSIESTLVAARLAAEQGDVVGARTLLERARSLVADLPPAQRRRLHTALDATEEGLAATEDAVRRGEPPPVWPSVPGLPGGDVPVVPEGPEVGPSRTAAPVPGLPGQPALPGLPGAGGPAEPAPSARDQGGTGGQPPRTAAAPPSLPSVPQPTPQPTPTVTAPPETPTETPTETPPATPSTTPGTDLPTPPATDLATPPATPTTAAQEAPGGGEPPQDATAALQGPRRAAGQPAARPAPNAGPARDAPGHGPGSGAAGAPGAGGRAGQGRPPVDRPSGHGLGPGDVGAEGWAARAVDG